MPNVPIDLPEDFCQEIVELPDCVQEFIEALSPFQFEQAQPTIKQSLQSFSVLAEGELENFKQTVRDFIQAGNTQAQIATTLDSLGQALKCPGDSDSCGSLSAAVTSLKKTFDDVTGQLNTLTGDDLIKGSINLGESLTQKFSALATLEGFKFECPNEELDPNNAAEETASLFDSTVRPEQITGLKPGGAINNAILLEWDPPSDTSVLLGYEIQVNNVPVAFVPYFMNQFLLKNLANDVPYKIKVIPVNTDPVPVTTQPATLCGIQAGNPYPVPTPIITESLPFDGGFNLNWRVDPDLIDVNDFVDLTYTATVVDSEEFFIVLNNDFQSIIEVRNDSFAGFNIYSLSGADISIGSTFRATLDLTKSVNIAIGLDRNDELFIDFIDLQDAQFISIISGGSLTIQLNNPELSVDASLQSVSTLRRLNVLDGEVDLFDLADLEILDHRTFQINAPVASGLEYRVELVSGIQTFTTDLIHSIEIDLLTSSGLKTFEATIDTTSPLVFYIDPLEDEDGIAVEGVPQLIEIRNINQNDTYNLAGVMEELGRNFSFNPQLSDILQVFGTIRRKVDYVNPTTGLLTLIDTSFSEVSTIFNSTKNLNYTISGLSLFKGSTLIKLDPNNPINNSIGMRDDDLIRCKNDDATIANFLINDPDSNSLAWKLQLNNFELGNVGVINTIRSITNVSRGSQQYNLTNMSFIDNTITLRQSDFLNSQIGIDPRDEIRIDYIWERFNSIKAFEIFVDEGGAGYEFLTRTGTQTTLFDLGSRALLKGTKQELFTITLETNTLQLQCNNEVIDITLQDGEDLTVIDIAADIRSKEPSVLVSTSSGFLLLGCINTFPRDPLGSGVNLNIPELPDCVNNRTCLINDYIKIVGGTALDILGFTQAAESVGISWENGIPLSLRVDAITRDGRAQPFSLAGPNYAQITPSSPIFNFKNILITAINPGYIYNPLCGNPADIACYPQANFAWVITFELESPNREIQKLLRLARATIQDTTDQIISLPIQIFSIDDIQSVERTSDFQTYTNYDLANIGITIASGVDLTVIDLDETQPTNAALGMSAFNQIGISLPDFYGSTGIITHIPNLPKIDSMPTPTITVEGTDVEFLTSDGFGTFGIDPFVRVRNVTATAPGYDPTASGLLFNQPLELSFEAISTKGVDSVSLWIKTKTNTLIPATASGAPLVLQAGSNAPNEPGLYTLSESIVIDITTPRHTRAQSITVGSPSFVVDDEGLIITNGEFDGQVLEFITGVKAGLKYRIDESTIATGFKIDASLSGVQVGDVFAIHRRSFPGAWPNPASSAFDISTAPGIPGKISTVFDIDDGFILLTMNADADIIAYTGDTSRETIIYSSTDPIRFNEIIDPSNPFLISGLNTLRFDDSYNPSDIDFVDTQNWNVSLLVQSSNPAPNILIEATALTKLGEQVIGQENRQL